MPLKTLFRLQSRRPLRTSNSLSLRWRVMLLAMSMVAMVVILMAVAVYAVISAALYKDIDNQLQSRAAAFDRQRIVGGRPGESH